MEKTMQELKDILEKFANSGWDTIVQPSVAWLNATEELLKSVKQADSECGNCGCEFDSLYKSVINTLSN